MDNLPAPPSFLNKEGKAEWVRIVAVLFARKAFDEKRRPALEAYCAAYGRWREAEEFITDRGIMVKVGNVVKVNPMLQISAAASSQMRWAMRDLGLCVAGDRPATEPTGVPASDLSSLFASMRPPH